MPAEKLVHMANQIGRFFAHAGEEGAAAGIAEHILKFWDPRMRAGICGHLRDGGAGLDAPVRRAVAALCGRIGPDGRLHPG